MDVKENIKKLSSEEIEKLFLERPLPLELLN